MSTAIARSIFVLNEGARSDYDSYKFTVAIFSVKLVDLDNPEAAPIEVITTDKGVFHRSMCYWDKSPYGWHKGEYRG